MIVYNASKNLFQFPINQSSNSMNNRKSSNNDYKNLTK